MITKKLVSALACLALTGSYAQDWDGIPIPANPPSGMTWELNPVSDSFNYESNSRNLNPEFTKRWNELYINGFSGPSATSYHVDHTWITGGTLNIHAAWDTTLPIIYTGCISSKATMTYPMFMEARVLQANCMLANNIWMISEDETEELDMLESYPNSQVGREYFDRRIHLSHHTFIREPFTDYQPRDEEGVFGTWYMEEDRETWRGDYFTIGVYWVNPHHAEYYINGQKVRTIKQFEHSFIAPNGTLSEHTTTFDALDKYGYTGGTGLSKPQHIIINMEQQSWLSDLNIFPTQDELDDANGKNLFKIDWIRVYDGVPVGGKIPVTGVELIPSNGITIRPGETFDFDYQISPADATQQIVTWTTSNTTIATINGLGQVTGIVAGTVTADAVTQDGNFLGRATVTVAGEPIGPINTKVPVEGVSISPASLTLVEGETSTVTAGIIPFNATIQSVVWGSSNSSIVTVSNVGDIIAVAEGTATITTTTLDGDKTDTISVTITAGDGGDDPTDSTNPTDPVVDGGTLNGGPFNFTVGDGIPDNVSGVSLSGNSGANSQYVVTDDQGNILGLPPTPSAVNFEDVGTGTCFIYHLSYEDGLTGLTAGENISNFSGDFDLSNKIMVNRIPAVITNPSGETIIIEAESFTNTSGTFNDLSSGGSGLGVNIAGTTINYVNSGDYADYSINVGQEGTYEIFYRISSPSDNAQIQLSVDNTVVATDNVPNNGSWGNYSELKSSDTINLSNGVQTIRITASGSNLWQWNLDSITLTKIDNSPSDVAVTAVALSLAAITLNEGDTQSLLATISPANATNQSVSFSSSNTNVATVNNNGLVSAISAGTTTITVTTADGNETDTTNVTVNTTQPAGNNIALNKTATHSSNYQNNANRFTASNAVDGNNDNFNHTTNESNAWLEVDLGSVSNITTIEVYNRNGCCQNRLSNFHVFVSNIPFTSTNINTTINQSAVGNYFTSGNAGRPTTISANRTGRYVRVQLSGSNFLHIAELVINGIEGVAPTNPTTPNTFTIEAEDFTRNGGTFNDAFAGGPGLGVNTTSTAINYVNSGDYTEYEINIPTSGTFGIDYLITTPSDNAQIQMLIDGDVVDTTNVPNNGSWDNYGNISGGNVTLSSGAHTVRINATGTNLWQWNLDKVTLSPIGSSKTISETTLTISTYPNPVLDIIYIEGIKANNTSQATLFDIAGSIVLQETTSGELNVSNLASGVYFLVINSNTVSSEPIKIIKTK